MMIPSCRLETYRHFYNVNHYHSNCFDNLNDSLKAFGIPNFHSIQPTNIFMNTTITQDKAIIIELPVSKAGSKITFRAEMDLVVGISACSITEGACNAGKCKPVLVQFID